MLINLKIIVVITNLLSCWVIICTLLDPIIKRWKHKGITWLWAGANKTSKSNPQYWPLAFFAGTLLWSQNLRCCFVRTAQGQSPQLVLNYIVCVIHQIKGGIGKSTLTLERFSILHQTRDSNKRLHQKPKDWCWSCTRSQPASKSGGADNIRTIPNPLRTSCKLARTG